MTQINRGEFKKALGGDHRGDPVASKRKLRKQNENDVRGNEGPRHCVGV